MNDEQKKNTDIDKTDLEENTDQRYTIYTYKNFAIWVKNSSILPNFIIIPSKRMTAFFY